MRGGSLLLTALALVSTWNVRTDSAETVRGADLTSPPGSSVPTTVDVSP